MACSKCVLGSARALQQSFLIRTLCKDRQAVLGDPSSTLIRKCLRLHAHCALQT